MKRGFVPAIAVLVLIFFFTLPLQAQQAVPVPNVVGLSVDQAIKALESAGLRGPVNYEMTTNQAQANKISKQNPAAGQKAAKGSAVVLSAYMYQAPAIKVNVTPAAIPSSDSVVPNVLGMKFVAASDAIRKAGYNYDNAAQFYMPTANPRCEGGCITKQIPAPGTKAPKTTKLQLWADYYVERPKVTVPDFRNLPIEDAKRKALAAGLTYGVSGKTVARPELDGKVFEQQPAPGATVYKGENVAMAWGIYKESALEVQAKFMPEAKTYLLMVRGGAQPYDVRASYNVPKNMAGQKVVDIIGLVDSPDLPEWKRYRIVNKIPIEAVMVVTDAKGRKHEYKLHLTNTN